MMRWKTETRPTTFSDPETGEPLYVTVNLFPRWYKGLRRLSLFLLIVWRVWDENPDGSAYRLSVRTAWEVSAVVWD